MFKQRYWCKKVWERVPTPEKGVGTPFPRFPTPLHPCPYENQGVHRQWLLQVQPTCNAACTGLSPIDLTCKSSGDNHNRSYENLNLITSWSVSLPRFYFIKCNILYRKSWFFKFVFVRGWVRRKLSLARHAYHLFEGVHWWFCTCSASKINSLTWQ